MGLHRQYVLACSLISHCTAFSRFPCVAEPTRSAFLRRSHTKLWSSRTGDDDHVKRYHLKGVTMKNNKSGVTVATSTGYNLQTDVPKEMGGQDSAPQPVETLLTALMGCTQATALFVSRNMKPRIVLGSLEMEFSAVRDERGALQMPIDQFPEVPSRLTQVSGTVAVNQANGQSIAPDALKTLKDQTEARCPVANMMTASGCSLDIDWIDANVAR